MAHVFRNFLGNIDHLTSPQKINIRVDGPRNPVNSPVEVGSLSHYLPTGVLHPKRWLGIGFLNPSTVAPAGPGDQQPQLVSGGAKWLLVSGRLICCLVSRSGRLRNDFRSSKYMLQRES